MTIDVDSLEDYLDVLSHANRLQLLEILRDPKTLGDIKLKPSAAQARGHPDRTISRQAVKNHLDRLADAGLVRVRRTRGDDGRTRNEYVLDPSRLFAVVEELNKLTTLETRVQPDPKETIPLSEREGPDWSEGPKLVLVHGVHEGRAYPLRPSEREPDRGWILGRADDAHVCLDYDPYVSKQNSEILRTDDGFRLLDLRTSKNGTRLNWRQLPVGGDVPLHPGDVIGVGRSLLVFRPGTSGVDA